MLVPFLWANASRSFLCALIALTASIALFTAFALFDIGKDAVAKPVIEIVVEHAQPVHVVEAH